MPRTNKTERLMHAVETMTCWSSGSDRPWQGDALLSADQLRLLTALAASAPARAIKAFEEAVS